MQQILAIKLGDIGDTLTITPALRAWRRTYPSDRITALVTENGRLVLERNDLIDDCVVFDKHLFDAAPGALRPGSMLQAARLGQGLRSRNFDTLLLFHHLTTRWGSLKYAALALGSGARLRAGLVQTLSDGRLRNRRGWFLNHTIPDGGFGARHEVDHWLALVESLGASVERPRIEFTSQPEEREWALSTISSLVAGEVAPTLATEAVAAKSPAPGERVPLIAIYPGSGEYSPARRWPPERFISVGRALQQQCKARIVVIGGPGEKELCQRVADGIPNATSLAGQTSLGQLAALLECCNLFLGNDGGPMHLAAAVGTRVVAIFGLTNHLAWGPYLPEDRCRIVRAGLPCSPCFYTGHLPGNRYGCDRMDCLNQVTPDTVLAAVRELIGSCRAE